MVDAAVMIGVVINKDNKALLNFLIFLENVKSMSSYIVTIMK